MLKAIAATTGKGTLGGACCFLGAMVASVDAWISGFKLAGVLIGVLIGVATLISIIFDIVIKKRQLSRGEKP